MRKLCLFALGAPNYLVDDEIIFDEGGSTRNYKIWGFCRACQKQRDRERESERERARERERESERDREREKERERESEREKREERREKREEKKKERREKRDREGDRKQATHAQIGSRPPPPPCRMLT